MEGALAWIGQIAEWVGQFIPRTAIVPATSGAVKYVWGKKVVGLGPGWYVFWPFSTEFHVYPTVRQAVDLRPQTIVTTDGKVIIVGGMVVIEIVDIVKIHAHTWDPDETIRDISLSAFHDVCCQKTWDQLQIDVRKGSFDREVRRELKKALDPYGETVIKTTLTDLAPCRVLKLVQSASKDGV